MTGATPMPSWHLTIRHSLVYRSVAGVFIGGLAAWILYTSVFESVDTIGSIVFGAFGVLGLVLTVRLVAACLVLHDDRIVLRGAFRTRSVRRADIARLQTSAFNGSSIATLRLWDESQVRLPLAAQGTADEMSRPRVNNPDLAQHVYANSCESLSCQIAVPPYGSAASEGCQARCAKPELR